MTTPEEIRKRAELDAKAHGYYLNFDPDFLSSLLEGLKVNDERYGYPSCPCRMATGDFELDRDIICPCDYRDPDVQEYGACYCCLYIDEETYSQRITKSIPERRPIEKQFGALDSEVEDKEPLKSEGYTSVNTKITDRKLFYCKVCGYVCFREEPPYVCPICRAKREFFSEIISTIELRTS